MAKSREAYQHTRILQEGAVLVELGSDVERKSIQYELLKHQLLHWTRSE